VVDPQPTTKRNPITTSNFISLSSCCLHLADGWLSYLFATLFSSSCPAVKKEIPTGYSLGALPPKRGAD
jgi:hypothetical protein